MGMSFRVKVASPQNGSFLLVNEKKVSVLAERIELKDFPEDVGNRLGKREENHIQY